MGQGGEEAKLDRGTSRSLLTQPGTHPRPTDLSIQEHLLKGNLFLSSGGWLVRGLVLSSELGAKYVRVTKFVGNVYLFVLKFPKRVFFFYQLQTFHSFKGRRAKGEQVLERGLTPKPLKTKL